MIAVMAIVTSLLTVAAPAVASTREPERSTTTTTRVVDTRQVEDESETRFSRFCAARPDYQRCQTESRDVSVRQLIWRLIKAGEWRQLFQLLHRLGII